jgi:hypothetical protein
VKKIFQVFFSLGLLVGMPGCISFKVEPLSAPPQVLHEVILCREIDESKELLEPGDAWTEFRANRDPVFCFLHLKEVAQKVVLKWKWYSPDKKIFKESEEAVINSEEIYLEAITAYDRIDPDVLAGRQGMWSVSIFLNDVLLTRLSFKVVPEALLNQGLHEGGLIP